MKQLTGQKKKYFENPIQNLGDLFCYILRELKSDSIWVSESKSKLRKGLLTVEFKTDTKGTEIIEQLVIRQNWDKRIFEQITYENRYEEMTAFITKEVVDTIQSLRSSPDLLKEVNKTEHEDNLPLFINAETFAANIEHVQYPESVFTYEATSISRALQTLANLRLMGYSSTDDGVKFIVRLTEELLYDEDVENELNRRFVGDHLKMLRLGKLQCNKPVFEQVASVGSAAEYIPLPWVLGHSIAKICKFYVGMLPKGFH